MAKQALLNNWMIISVIAVIVVVLIVFVVTRNRKDERQLEDQLNQDYHKPKMHDVETDEPEST